MFSIETYRLLSPFPLLFSEDKRSYHSARETVVGVASEVVMEACMDILMFCSSEILERIEEGDDGSKSSRFPVEHRSPPDGILGLI